MTQVFADTVYWIATAAPNDQWHAAAREARRRLGRVELVTTDEVLTEFLAALSRGGPRVRLAAARLARYEARGDKEYGLQDCASMNVMEDESVTQVLTNDHHFEQEGFTLLMKRNVAAPTPGR